MKKKKRKADSHFKLVNIIQKLPNLKRSQSSIIATVLLILLVLAALVIVWNIVHYTIKTKSLEAKKLSSCIVSYIDIEKVDNNNMEFVIRRRGGGDFNIASVKLIVDRGNPQKLTDVCTGLASEPDFRNALSSVKCVFSEAPTKSIEAFLELDKSVCPVTGKIEISPLPEIPPKQIGNGDNSQPGSTIWDFSSLIKDYELLINDIISPVDKPEDIEFSPDGKKMFILGYLDGKVHQFNLNTDWEISTANYYISSSISNEISPIHNGFVFNSDGTKMYVIKYPNIVNEYSISSPWDISNLNQIASFNVEGFDLALSYSGIAFNTDGTKMYLQGHYKDFYDRNVYQFTLDTAWDITTTRYDSISFTAIQVSNYQDLFLKPVGKNMFLLSNYPDKIFKYSLNNDWDISNVNYNNINFVVDSFGSGGFTFSVDGKKLYVVSGVSSTKKIFQYSTVTN